MTTNGHLPAGELRVLLEAQSLVEAGIATWETPVGFERCHLCRRPLIPGRYVEAGGLLWCPDFGRCKQEALRRLGVRGRRA